MIFLFYFHCLAHGCRFVEARPLDLPRITRPLGFLCIGTNPPAAMAGLQRRRYDSVCGYQPFVLGIGAMYPMFCPAPTLPAAMAGLQGRRIRPVLTEL